MPKTPALRRYLGWAVPGRLFRRPGFHGGPFNSLPTFTRSLRRWLPVKERRSGGSILPVEPCILPPLRTIRAYNRLSSAWFCCIWSMYKYTTCDWLSGMLRFNCIDALRDQPVTNLSPQAMQLRPRSTKLLGTQITLPTSQNQLSKNHPKFAQSLHLRDMECCLTSGSRFRLQATTARCTSSYLQAAHADCTGGQPYYMRYSYTSIPSTLQFTVLDESAIHADSLAYESTVEVESNLSYGNCLRPGITASVTALLPVATCRKSITLWTVRTKPGRHFTWWDTSQGVFKRSRQEDYYSEPFQSKQYNDETKIHLQLWIDWCC